MVCRDTLIGLGMNAAICVVGQDLSHTTETLITTINSQPKGRAPPDNVTAENGVTLTCMLRSGDPGTW